MTDDRQTDGRQRHIANVNVTSRSLKSLRRLKLSGCSNTSSASVEGMQLLNQLFTNINSWLQKSSRLLLKVAYASLLHPVSGTDVSKMLQLKETLSRLCYILHHDHKYYCYLKK